MLDTILLNLPGIFFLLVFVGLIAFCVWYLKAFYAGRAEKQKAAEEQRRRHGGGSGLEWSEPYAQGEPRFPNGSAEARPAFMRKAWYLTPNGCPIRI